jgi:hypothetical protein
MHALAKGFTSLFLASTLATAVGADAETTAAEDTSPETTVAAVANLDPIFATDTSRNFADPRFRERLKVMALLPQAFGTQWQYRLIGASTTQDNGDHVLGEAPIERERWSDYYDFFQGIHDSDNHPKVVVVAGDGVIEVVRPGMPAEYLAATESQHDQVNRETINQTVTESAHAHLTSHAEASEIRWLVVTPGELPEVGEKLWEHLASTEDVQQFDLMSADMMQVAVSLQDLNLIPEPVTLTEIDASGADTYEVAIPEGTIQSVLVLDHQGELENATLVASEGRQSQAIDDVGNLRVWVIDSVETGGTVTLNVQGSGKSDVFLLEHRQINHHMEIAHVPNFDNFFPGDPVTITHHLTTVTGAGVSAELATELLGEMVLERDGTALTDIANDTLPAEPTLAIYKALFPEAPFVTSTASSVEVLFVEPLAFAGGFSEESIWAAQDAIIDISMARTGGRQQLASFDLPINSPGRDAPLIVEMKINPQDPSTFVGQLPATNDNIGTYLIDPAQIEVRGESASIQPLEPLYAQTEVMWDYRMWMYLAIATLILLIALFLWWFLTRPRWQDEVIWTQDGGYQPAGQVPGPKPRNTSYLSESLQGNLVVTKTRKDYQIHPIFADCEWYCNGHRITSEEPFTLTPGSDLEVVFENGQRSHVRFFASEGEGNAWNADKDAMIDLESDFTDIHFVVE